MTEKKNKYSSIKYLKVFILSCIAFLFCIGSVSYIVDPFFQFRVNTDGRYILNPRFVNGGLAKHYDYNTVFLGSSMFQNLDMSVFRDNFPGTKPVKLSSGGMNITEMLYLYSFVQMDSVKDMVINIDMPLFARMDKSMRYPAYLYEDKLINKLKYLYGYETLVQFVPADIGMTLYFKNAEDIPESFKMKTDIDNIGSDRLASVFSADVVKHQYLNNIRGVSYLILDSMNYRMEKNWNETLEKLEIEKYPDINYTFLFPSYSALYWHHTRESGYYHNFMKFVHYFVQSVEKYKNVKVAFFFDREEITDLNHYSDITHFGPLLSDSIALNIYNPKYELTTANIGDKIQRTDSLINSFIEQNRDWLRFKNKE